MVLEQDSNTVRQVTKKRPLYTEQDEDMVDSDDSTAGLSNTSKYDGVVSCTAL